MKVGDKVKILHTDYPGLGLDVGTVHEIKNQYEELVFLESSKGDTLCFYDHEVEPVNANTIQLNQTYTSKNGTKWECIAVRRDTAWLAGLGCDGKPDEAAYRFKTDGTNICQGGGDWNIQFEPVVEWVNTKGSWAKAGCHPQRQYNYAIRFPLIDGKPDFTQATVTTV